MTPRIREIEEEFGEPIYDVVASFAADGESKRSTGAILGFHPQYFSRRVLPKIDPDRTIEWWNPRQTIPFLDGQRSDSARANHSRATKEQWRRKTQVTIDGVAATKKEWREYYGIHQDTVRKRMRKYGWTFEQAVKTPPTPIHLRRKSA